MIKLQVILIFLCSLFVVVAVAALKKMERISLAQTVLQEQCRNENNLFRRATEACEENDLVRFSINEEGIQVICRDRKK